MTSCRNDQGRRHLKRCLHCWEKHQQQRRIGLGAKQQSCDL